MILDRPYVTPAELERRTGWTVRPEGACKGERCVPLPDEAKGGVGVDLRMLAERLRMGVVYEEDGGLWAIGPESGGHALASAEAPDFTLPDREGRDFSLSSLRGTKVFLLAWASW